MDKKFTSPIVEENHFKLYAEYSYSDLLLPQHQHSTADKESYEKNV